MDPVTEAITLFQDDCRDFREDPKARILRVVVEQKHIGTLIKALRAEEWSAGNMSPFLVFDHAYTANSNTYDDMSQFLRQHYKLLQKSFAEQEKPLPDLDVRPRSDTDPLSRFALHIERFRECIRVELDPPYVCWLPVVVDDYKRWSSDCSRLLSYFAQSRIRFVIGDQQGNHLADALKTVKQACMTTTFDIDENKLGDYFKQMMSKPSPGRARGTLPGAAAPDVEPPPRPGKPPPTPEESKAAMEAAGLPPVLSEQEGERLRALIFEAAQASGNKDAETAIKRQREACELCANADVKLEQAMMTLLLANYLLQFGSDKLAEAQYRQAIDLAESVEAYPQVAQIRLGLAYLLLKNKRVDEAAQEYEAAAAAAQLGESNLLFIESHRMAGTCHLQQKRQQDAVRCWQAAADQSREASPDEVRVSGFLDVAQELISLLRKNGLEQQAQSVEALVAEVGEKQPA